MVQKRAYTMSTKCGVYLHFFPQHGSVDFTANCFINNHKDSKFGLCAIDQPLVGKRKKDRKDTSTTKKKHNRHHIDNLKMDLKIHTSLVQSILDVGLC